MAAHDATKHAAEIVQSDTKKFRIAKLASELEIESERLESELDMLNERLADLEAQGLEGDEATRRSRENEDNTMCVMRYGLYICKAAEMLILDDRLRLKFYRSLGVDVEADEAGNLKRAVIRNNRKGGDVDVLNIDPKFPPSFYTSHFWSTMRG